LAALTTSVRADESALGPVPRQGLLMLRNGQAIEGKISRVGDLYYVAVPNGQIRVKAAEVEFCCPDFEEGYRRKKAIVQLGNVQEHLRLAQWCQRHGLYGHAGAELAAAMDADPTHPMIGVIERRLKAAMEPKRPHSAPSARPGKSSPSSEDLDRLIRGMPPGTVEKFTQTIQPLLANNCTAAACHGPTSKSDFRLSRIPIDRPASRRLTQRNLHATLKWIDSENPIASRLIVAPAGPHGTAKTAVFTDRQIVQYKHLVDWVRLVAGRRGSAKPAAPVTVAPKQQPPVHAMPAESGGFGPQPSQVVPASHEESQENPFHGHQGPKRGARLPRFVPADPFDPEIFNRRYFGRD